MGCIKDNSDGLSKGNLGRSVAGGVFRDSKGSFLRGYCFPLGDHTTYYADIFCSYSYY